MNLEEAALMGQLQKQVDRSDGPPHPDDLSLEQILDAVSRFRNNHVVTSLGVGLLYLKQDFKPSRKKLIDRGAIEVLTDVIHRHPGDKNLKRYGEPLLVRLQHTAMSMDEFMSQIPTLYNLVANFMMKQFDSNRDESFNSSALLEALYAIHDMIEKRENRADVRAILQHGALEMLQAIIHRYPENEELVNLCLEMMETLVLFLQGQYRHEQDDDFNDSNTFPN